MHLKERMHALEEKNALTQELEKTRKIMEDLQGEKVRNYGYSIMSRLEVRLLKIVARMRIVKKTYLYIVYYVKFA